MNSTLNPNSVHVARMPSRANRRVISRARTNCAESCRNDDAMMNARRYTR